MQDWNRRLKIVAAALRLQRNDVARAATLGGIPTSNSAAHAWLCSETAKTLGVRGQVLRKNRPMSEAEFDAFLAGLSLLLSEIEGSQE